MWGVSVFALLMIVITSAIAGAYGGLLVMFKSLTKRVTILEERLRQLDKINTPRQKD